MAYQNGSLAAKSCWRLIRCGYVPGVVVNYIHPDDYTFDRSGRSPGSPSIVKLEGGVLLASHGIFWGNGGQNLSHVFRSDDGGISWRFVSEVSPCFWGKLFTHGGKLYMLGMSHEYGALNLFESSDEGQSWSAPAEILPEGNRDVGGPHKAPMPALEHHGRLWTGIDFGSWSLGGHASGAVSIDVNGNLMDPKEWSCTGFIKQDATWKDAPIGNARGTLEGNLVAGKDGEVYNILRYQHDACEPKYGKAVMLHIDQEHPDALPKFERFLDFPGNLTKFAIYYDERTDCYYSLVNRVTGGNMSQRNILSLMYSENLLDWHLKRDILNYEDRNFPEDSTKVGFQYVDFVFDGEDIVFAGRIALNNAYNFHNANHLTVQRIRNYAL